MKRVLILFHLILALVSAGQAEQFTPEQLASVVRIVSFGKADNKGMIYGSSGTGFVISNDGLIMTNNHVIASSPEKADHPDTYIVLQKVGDKITAYRATFVAQDPDADLAVIRCVGIKAKPFPLLTTPVQRDMDVWAVGFPGVADDLNLNHTKFAIALDQELSQAGQTSLDITDLIKQNKVLVDFVVPSSSKGQVERLTDIRWLNEVEPYIQHSCITRHGNSGGPLLNGGGQVVGVVGDGHNGKDNDQTNYALQTSRIQTFLQVNNITGYTFTNQPWVAPSPFKGNLVAIIVSAAIAVAIALAALLITLLKARKKTGITLLLDSLRQKGITSGTKLIKYVGDKQSPSSQPASSMPNLPPIAGGNWKLDGRTSGGRTFQIPLSDSMFASNGSRIVLGRTPELCHVVVDDDTVSRQHAEIRKNGTGFVVADRNSSNGTAVNGVFNRRPFDPVPLKPGDTLTLGEVKLNFTGR